MFYAIINQHAINAIDNYLTSCLINAALLEFVILTGSNIKNCKDFILMEFVRQK